jgi:hypothetical protein
VTVERARARILGARCPFTAAATSTRPSLCCTADGGRDRTASAAARVGGYPSETKLDDGRRCVRPRRSRHSHGSAPRAIPEERLGFSRTTRPAGVPSLRLRWPESRRPRAARAQEATFEQSFASGRGGVRGSHSVCVAVEGRGCPFGRGSVGERRRERHGKIFVVRPSSSSGVRGVYCSIAKADAGMGG